MNLTQLRKQKTFNAVRIDENYSTNDDNINAAREYLKKQGNVILSEKQNFNYDFEYCNPEKIEDVKMYCNGCEVDKLLNSFKKHNKQASIISHKLDGKFLIIKCKGASYSFGVMINKSMLEQKTSGVMTFRASGDYIFTYTDRNGKEHNLFGEKIKAHQLNHNSLTVTDFNGEEYRYELEILD